MTPAEIAYLKERAKTAGYNADDLMRVMNYESSSDPTRWGGKGGQYFGLIQFGPEERKQFGVDTKNPSAQNQIDATFKYLSARGYKPGMGLLDLYSTVLAGSPGHYNRADQNGTVAQHVAKMGGSAPISEEPKITGSVSVAPDVMAYQTNQPRSIEDIINSMQIPTTNGFLGRSNKPVVEEPQEDDINQILKDMHDRQHMASLQGLLGAN